MTLTVNELSVPILVFSTFFPSTTATFLMLRETWDLQESLHMFSPIFYYYQSQLFKSVTSSSTLHTKSVSAHPWEGCPRTLLVRNLLLFFFSPMRICFHWSQCRLVLHYCSFKESDPYSVTLLLGPVSYLSATPLSIGIDVDIVEKRKWPFWSAIEVRALGRHEKEYY